jgi:hypothetical protein
MSGFTKLFCSILDSTIWSEDNHTRLVWITMLAMADRRGHVDASVPGLAIRARVPIDQCEQALAILSAPDKYSRSSAFEGRRIEAIEGGWKLLNYLAYRRKLSADERREYFRHYQRERRAQKLTSVDTVDMSTSVNTSSACQPKITHKQKQKDQDLDLDQVQDQKKIQPSSAALDLSSKRGDEQKPKEHARDARISSNWTKVSDVPNHAILVKLALSVIDQFPDYADSDQRDELKIALAKAHLTAEPFDLTRAYDAALNIRRRQGVSL